MSLRPASALGEILRRIDGKGYKAYRDLGGSYRFPRFELYIDHVQGDAFAAPSRLRARVPMETAGFPRDLYGERVRGVALADFLTRAFWRACQRFARRPRGTGQGGLIQVTRPGPAVLERTAMAVTPDYVEARFSVGLPATGRTVLGREAREMLCEEIPRIVAASLEWGSLSAEAARAHVNLVADQEYLRACLGELGLVAFVGDGAVLPRRSGVSELPLPAGEAVPFASPPELAVEVRVPHHGKVRGMGIPRGVTLIVGGGYHGKTTLLRALERGVYNHVAGDGREWVITAAGAVKIRAEDGRRVEQVDISPFITDLPLGRATRAFSTEDASGSTSQAANIVEALEVGATVLLIDEDTSATNFMVRDARMQALVPKGKEPVTPFVDRVRQLYEELGVSTVLVVGGSGDYLDVADRVLWMDHYLPRDITARAREVAAARPTGRRTETAGPFGPLRPRAPLPGGLDPSRGPRGRPVIRGQGTDELRFGREAIDLSQVEQLVEPGQTEAIGLLLHYAARRYADGRTPLREVVARCLADVDREGLDVLSPYPGRHPGDYGVRAYEVAAACNRLRTLQAVQRPGEGEGG